MFLQEETYELNGRKITLRGPRAEDAETMIDYLKTVCGETPYLCQYGDEVQLTLEDELKFIESRNKSETGYLIMVFEDGEYAGNVHFERKGISRRAAHRASIGIAFFQKNTGHGLGRFVLNRLLELIKEKGYEQAELTVLEGNDRAKHLYESLGFVETGRIKNANKYDDGTYRDDILMVNELKGI
jgi:RimJ/RimL family protein N-acetyltransferase